MPKSRCNRIPAFMNKTVWGIFKTKIISMNDVWKTYEGLN